MTDINEALAKIEAAEKAMTPGEWRYVEWPNRGAHGRSLEICPGGSVHVLTEHGSAREVASWTYTDENAAGIALLRNVAPALLAVARAAAEMLADLDAATGPDEWSTSETREALAALVAAVGGGK